MKTHSLFTFGALAVSSSLAVPASATALCELPVTAYLTDDEGTPLDGLVDVELRFYLEPIGSAPAECRSFEDAEVARGWLRITVDACEVPEVGDCGVAPIRTLVGASPELFVGVVVDSGDELTPRFSVGAVPYAVTAFDAQNLGGAAPDAYEASGTAEGLVSGHVANADAHHQADSSGLRIEPDAATVGDIHVEGDTIDFGPDADDALSAEMVSTLVGGGNADALHEHAAGSSSGGSCYTAWGPTTCIEAYTLVYEGVAVNGWMYDNAGGTVAQGDTICLDAAVIASYVSDISAVDFRGVAVMRDGQEGVQLTGDRMTCALCCR